MTLKRNEEYEDHVIFMTMSTARLKMVLGVKTRYNKTKF